MNQLPLVRDHLSEIHLTEVRNHPSREVGHEELLLMVEKNQEAALMGVQPKDPVRAAKLCFDQVDPHFGAISALLGNDQVFEEVARTLCQMKDSNDPVEQKKAVAVALAALTGGQPMDVSNEDWPLAVRQVLQERLDTSEKYWREKKKKFELQKEKYPSVIVPTSQKPFFSSDPKRFREPFQHPIEAAGTLIWERHFVQAFLEHPGTVLKELSTFNFSSFDVAQLDANYLKNCRGGGKAMVHVVPENFGKLLVCLSHQVPKNGTREFRGLRCLKDDFTKARSIVVRLSKKSHDDPMVKVSLYVPYMALADTPHLKVLPEKLGDLSFSDFDVSGIAGMERVDILCLDVGDQALAQALAGQLVPDTPDLNVSSWINALYWGGVHQMRQAASALSVQGFEMLSDRAKELGDTVALAVHTGSHDLLEELIRSPLLEKLDAKTLEAMVRAEGLGGKGFPLAIQSGRADAVIAMGALLNRVKDRLPKGVAEEVLLSREAAVQLLVNAPEQVAVAYGEVIGKCFDGQSPSFMFTTDISSIRQFLMPQKLSVKRFLLNGMSWTPNALNALLRHTQVELMLFLTTERVESIRAALELVIAVQTGRTKLDKGAASVLLKEIRFACGQHAKFLCCGPQVNSDLFKAAVKSDPQLHKLFQEAVRLLQS